MPHEAKLVAGSGPNAKIYFGRSGSPDREVSIATAEKSNNQNVKIYLAFLDSISGKFAHAEKTEINDATRCAEPHAILKALAAGEDPHSLRFEYIHDVLNSSNSPEPDQAQPAIRDAFPCEGYCGKYIINMAFDWNKVTKQLEKIAGVKADVAKKLTQTDDYKIQRHQRRNIIQEGNKKIAAGNKNLTQQAKRAKYKNNAPVNNSASTNNSGPTPSNTNAANTNAPPPTQGTQTKKFSYADMVRK